MAKLFIAVFLFFTPHLLKAQLGASNIGNSTLMPDSIGYIAIGKAATQKCAIPGPCGRACALYTFIGAGEWNIEGNWEGGLIPPSILTGCFEIIINPANNAECILNIPRQILPKGTIITVAAGKRFLVPGSLIIQDQ